MTDWKALARARSLDVPEEAIDAIAGSLSQLETGLASMLSDLPDDLGMAPVFEATPERP